MNIREIDRSIDRQSFSPELSSCPCRCHLLELVVVGFYPVELHGSDVLTIAALHSSCLARGSGSGTLTMLLQSCSPNSHACGSTSSERKKAMAFRCVASPLPRKASSVTHARYSRLPRSKTVTIKSDHEYMERGTLDTYLLGPGRDAGVARGIRYLHEECQQKIMHHDMEPGNVLLDGELNPKVATSGSPSS
ncbi:hypothetical protein ACP4OV_011819 [Aristida adscensionis]